MTFYSTIFMITFLCVIATNATSKYEEDVSWNEQKNRWEVNLDFNGTKSKYYFDNQLDAIKTRNRSYKKMETILQNPEISGLPVLNKQTQSSKYKGVNWVKKSRKWRAYIYLGDSFKQGGTYNNQLDAAKRVNQMCDEFKIKRKNPDVNASPNPDIKNETSEYRGVSWNVQYRKWTTVVCVNRNRYHGGYFDEEIEAAQKVNQLCDELGTQQRNPELNTIVNSIENNLKPPSKSKVDVKTLKRKRIKNLKHKNVQKDIKKGFNKTKPMSRVDEDESEFVIDDEQRTFEQTEENTIFQPLEESFTTCHDDYDAIQAELQSLITILDTINDPFRIIFTIKKNLLAVISHGEKTTMKKINLRTENGESAISIAAKHGFSTIVKFLVSNGA